MRLAATARTTTDRWLDGIWSRARTTWEAVAAWWSRQPFLRHQLPLFLAIVAAVVYFVIFARLSWLRHSHFGTFDYDLGMYDQGIWQLAHGRNFMTVRGMDLFAHHANIGYLLFVPAYWFGAGPQFLDLVNTLGIVAVAWPVYLLGRVQMRSRWAGFWMVLIYLGHFSPQWKIQETFHPESLAAPFIVGAFYLATQGRWRWYWWCILGALVWKEDVALVIVVLGVVVMFLFHERRRGLLTALAGAVWFVVATKLFMPIFQDSGAVFDGLFGALGANVNEVVWNSVRHPTMLGSALYEHEAKQGALDLMAPYGYTGIVSPHLLALGAPQHVINFASVQNFTWDLRWHYAFFPYIAVLLASIQTVVTRKRVFISWALIFVMVGGVYVTREQGVGPWAQMNYNGGYWPHTDSPRNEAIRQLIAKIPDDAAVSTLYYVVPHLSHREQIYTFPNPWKSSNYGVDGIPAPPDPSVVDYLFVDEAQVCPPNTTPEPPDCALYATIKDSGAFELEAEVDTLKLWKRVLVTGFDGDLLPVPRLHDRPDQVGGVFRRLPAVAAVVDQVWPYAAYWDARNLAALDEGDDGRPWWCALGDSAAQGVGATSPEGGWVGRVDHHLRLSGREHRLFNLSVSGARVRDLIDTQVPRLAALTDRFGPPALVTTAIGGNDIFRSANVGAIRRDFTVLSDLLPAGSLLSRVAQARWSLVGRLVNEHIDQVASSRGLRLVDVGRYYHSPFRDRVASDRFHPNDLGYEQIAHAFTDVLDA